MHTTTPSDNRPLFLYAVIRTDAAMAGAASEPISMIQARAISERLSSWAKGERPQSSAHHWIVVNCLYQLGALTDCGGSGHTRLRRHLYLTLEHERWHLANRAMPVANTAAGAPPNIYPAVAPSDPRARYFALPLFLCDPAPTEFTQPMWLPDNHSLAGQLAHILHIDPQQLHIIGIVPEDLLLDHESVLTEVVLTDAIAQAYRGHTSAEIHYGSATIHLRPDGAIVEAGGNDGPNHVCERALLRSGVPHLVEWNQERQRLTQQQGHTTSVNTGRINGTPRVNSAPLTHMAIQ